MKEKRFHFCHGDETTATLSSSCSSTTSLTVSIKEDLDHAANDNYGCYTWISAPVLAHYVWRHHHRINERHIIEIGAGPSLPGIVAGHCGAASLTLADSRVFHPAALKLARKNAELNGLTSARVIDVTWGLVGPEMKDSPTYDVVLASDCFYDARQFEEVVFTIATLLQKCSETNVKQQQQQLQHRPERQQRHEQPEQEKTSNRLSKAPAEVWMSYQERSSGRSIRHFLSKYRLRCVEEICWDDFYDSASSEKERQSLNHLNEHHQIRSVWILIIRRDDY